MLFDNGWEVVGAKSTGHFKVNGFANAWILQPSENSQDFYIEYVPQRIFYVIMAVNLAIICAGAGMFLSKKLKAHK